MMASLDCEAIIFLLDYRQSLIDGKIRLTVIIIASEWEQHRQHEHHDYSH